MNETGQIVKNFGPLEYPANHPKHGQVHPQSKFLSTNVDIGIYGGGRGGGKTFSLLLEPLRYSRNPKFNGVIFRRSYGEIYDPGGPWDVASDIYPWAGGKPNGNDWYFDSGARITFSHMYNKDDYEKWRGAQIPLIMFDQLEMFNARHFFLMLGSNRDPHGVCRPYVRATCNPEPGWLADFISWWWDPDTGYPIPERDGVVRWMVRIGEALKWADTREQLKARYPNSSPMSVTFIQSLLEDNLVLDEKDPSYRGRLEMTDVVTQERWIHGNWKVKPAAGVIFNRAWWNPPGKDSRIIETSRLPVAMSIFRLVRAWDIASTPEGEGEDPDWTAGVLMGMYAGQFYVFNVKRFRRTPKETEDEIRLTASMDGVAVAVRMNEGANEKSTVDHYSRNVLQGYDFQGVPTRGRNKVLRAGPYSSAVQNGNVFLVRQPGSDNLWIPDYIDELDAFQGLDEKNDQVDASTDAHFVLTENTGAWDSSTVQGIVTGNNDSRMQGFQRAHFTPRR
ncbi:MAG: phage terminase large subunit [Patescibacteria group bacterium]|nr:phage terminase large subunit [Patescibacteria group bacterium]